MRENVKAIKSTQRIIPDKIISYKLNLTIWITKILTRNMDTKYSPTHASTRYSSIRLRLDELGIKDYLEPSALPLVETLLTRLERSRTANRQKEYQSSGAREQEGTQSKAKTELADSRSELKRVKSLFEKAETEAKNQIQELEKEVETIKNEKFEALEALKISRKETQKHKGKISILQKRNQAEKKQIKQLRTKIENLLNKNHELNKKIISLKALKTVPKMSKSQKEKRIIDLEIQNENLLKKKSDMALKIQLLISQLDQKDSRIADLELQKDLDREKIKSLELKIGRLDEKYLKNQAEMDNPEKFWKLNNEVSLRNTTSLNTAKRFKQQMITNQVEVNELQKRLRVREAVLIAIKQRMGIQTRETQTEQTKMKKNWEIVKKLDELFGGKESDVKKLRANLTKTEEKNRELLRRLNEVDVKMRRLEDEAKDKDQEIRRLKNEIELRKEKKKQVTNWIDNSPYSNINHNHPIVFELKEKIGSLQTEIDLLSIDKEYLRNQFEAVCLERDQLKVEIEDKLEKMDGYNQALSRIRNRR